MESARRFVRFVVPVFNEHTACATGIFQVSSLWERTQVPPPVRRHVQEALAWYAAHLPVPPVVKKRRDCVCWFRREPEGPQESAAHEPLRRAFVLAAFLRTRGVPVETLQTSDPGRVLYEDRWQIAALPRKATPRGRVGAPRVVVV